VVTTSEIREKIAKVSQEPLESHGAIFSEINDKLSVQLQEIESA
jgi:hypothetical protein